MLRNPNRELLDGEKHKDIRYEYILELNAELVVGISGEHRYMCSTLYSMRYAM